MDIIYLNKVIIDVDVNIKFLYGYKVTDKNGTITYPNNTVIDKDGNHFYFDGGKVIDYDGNIIIYPSNVIVDRNKNIKSSDVLIFFQNNDNSIFDVFKPLEIKINLAKSTEDVKLSENGKRFINY